MTTAIETITFDVAMDELLERIRADYRGFKDACARDASTDEIRDNIREEMYERFANGLEIEEGRKYLKVTTTCGSNQRSVWGFIVKKDGGKFRAGDILKAASWAAPATNAPRGNIFDEGYVVRWTGPLYLS